jgi:tetratricopeptide (TPR) repeat protein
LEAIQNQGRDPETRRAAWQQARTCFQEAVLNDPDNWLARFNLGTVLRKLGLNGAAAEQFRELLRSGRLPPAQTDAVKYNLASALQKADDDRLAHEALVLLDEILSSQNGQNGTAPRVTLDPLLERLAESGRVATWADRLVRRKRAMERSHPDKTELDRFKNTVETWLSSAQAAMTRLEEAAKHDPGNNEQNNVVSAVMLNAVGQMQNLSRKEHAARDSFRRAITLLPTFVEPRLNLAGIYYERKGSLDPNWASRAETLLLDLKGDPTEVRAATLLGALYAHPVFGRTDEAIKQFQIALPNPQAGRRLGALLMDVGRPADAVAPLLSAAQQVPQDYTVNYLLAQCAVKLPAADPRRCKLLVRSEKWLQDQVRTRPAGNRYSRLLQKVQTTIELCSKSSNSIDEAHT